MKKKLEEDFLSDLKQEMTVLNIKNTEVAKALGVHSSIITTFFNRTKTFSEETSKKYVDAIQLLIDERNKRRELLVRSINGTAEKLVPLKKALKRSVRMPKSDQTPIIERIETIKKEMDALGVSQSDVSEKTGIGQPRISRFFNGFPYIKKSRNQRVLDACMDLVNEKKAH